MRRVSDIASLELALLLGLAAVAFAHEGPALGLSPRCSGITKEASVPYDLSAMRVALAALTHWDVTDWPAPQIQELPPDTFQSRTELDHHHFLGDYEPGTNRVFVNLICRCQVPDHPEAFCQAVLFHELVHWGQHKSGIDKVINPAEQEHQALEYETQYLETNLGISDVYSPARPTPAELPPLTKPIRLNRLQPRATIRDAAGQPQALWILTGVWTEATTLHEYRAQAIAHRGHWVGLEIFEVNPDLGLPKLVESWWDEGYVRQDGITFPTRPIYLGHWVRVK